MRTQLLCTFTNSEAYDTTIKSIIDAYEVIFNKIYVFSNKEDENDIMCTYNVDPINLGTFVSNTISLHRKKQTNTLYTINALNEVIKSLNNGVLDKTFQIPWEEFSNSLLVTNDKTGYTRVETILKEIVSTNPQYLPQKPKK
jgi:hypothetical protein